MMSSLSKLSLAGSSTSRWTKRPLQVLRVADLSWLIGHRIRGSQAALSFVFAPKSQLEMTLYDPE